MTDVASDVPTTDSSSVAVVDPQVALSDLTPQERQQWRKSGEKPTRKATTAPITDTTPTAVSSPAAPADPVESTDSSIPPASEPGTPTRKKQNAESRKAELDAEIQERLGRRRQLEQEIAESEARLKQATPADTKPQSAATPTENFPEFEDWLTIAGNEAKGLGAYTKAVVAFERERATADARVEQAKTTRFQTYASRMNAAIADDPDWQAKVSPEIAAMIPVDRVPPGQPVQMVHILAQEILESSAPYQVQCYLTDHPETLRGLLGLPTAAEVIRHVASLSARVMPTAASSAPVKTTTDAPPPPPQIGSRPHTPDDDLLNAARSGDFRRYRDTANAADVARMRARGGR